MAITASVQPESGRIAARRIPLLASSSIPFFERRPGSYSAKPARIWNGWPGRVWAKTHLVHQAKRIWFIRLSKPVCKKHRAWFKQNAAGPLPVCQFVPVSAAFVHRLPRLIFCKNQAGPDLVLADCVRFWPVSRFGQTGPVRKLAGVHESLGQLQYSTIQFYCLCVEKFAFWLVIYVKTFNTINNKTTTQRNTELKNAQIQGKYLTITMYKHTQTRTHACTHPPTHTHTHSSGSPVT